jgi:hypothetical protein
MLLFDTNLKQLHIAGGREMAAACSECGVF